MNKFYIALAAAVVGIAALPLAAKAAETTASASATIVTPLTITKNSDLSFGSLSPSAIAGTVTMTVGGTRTGDANVELIPGGTITAAEFAVAGEGTATFSSTIDSTATLNGSGTAAGNTMTTTLVNNAPSGLTAGAATINVGGVLAVGVNQVAGPYSGTFNVTVAYN